MVNLGGFWHINGHTQSRLHHPVRGISGLRPRFPRGSGGDEGRGRRAELPLKKQFLLQKSHGSLDLDRNCPVLSIFVGMHQGHGKADG